TTFADFDDPTKKLKLDLSAISVETTEVVAYPGQGDLVTTVANQTLSGILTLDAAPTLKEVSTPSSPASGYKKLYPKTDGKFYTLDSDGNEVAVGSGAGGGSINLNGNPNGESGVDLGATNDVGDYVDEGGTGTAVS